MMRQFCLPFACCLPISCIAHQSSDKCIVIAIRELFLQSCAHESMVCINRSASMQIKVNDGDSVLVRPLLSVRGCHLML